MPQAILVFDRLISKKYSPLKPLSQMNWNLVGIIYRRFSIKIAHFVPIHWQTWPPQVIEISNLHKEPSINASYLVSAQLAKHGRIILEIDQSETRMACGGHVY
jgi:hypothetical protein